MKKIAMLSLFLIPAAVTAQDYKVSKKTGEITPIEQAPAPLDENKALYSLGVAISKNLTGYNFSAKESEGIIKGFSEALKNEAKEGDYDFKLINEYITKKQTENAKAEKEKAKEYLAKAAKEKGAKKTKSGLIYTITEKGKGQNPKAEDTVKVHYKGYLSDGKTFDSSYDRGEPAEFPLVAVVPCWTEGLQLIKKGGKARLVCPSDIAYGDMGRPPVIPGGATLVFEVELLDIIKEAPEPVKVPGTPEQKKN